MRMKRNLPTDQEGSASPRTLLHDAALSYPRGTGLIKMTRKAMAKTQKTRTRMLLPLGVVLVVPVGYLAQILRPLHDPESLIEKRKPRLKRQPLADQGACRLGLRRWHEIANPQSTMTMGMIRTKITKLILTTSSPACPPVQNHPGDPEHPLCCGVRSMMRWKMKVQTMKGTDFSGISN
jgi:hypothetical protein